MHTGQFEDVASGPGGANIKNVFFDWAERCLAALIFLPFGIANYRQGDWTNWTVATMEAAIVFLVLIRRRAINASERPLDWALAFAGTMLPMFARPGGEHFLPPLAGALVIIGFLVSFSAKLSLNRRFGLVPANRGVQTDWAYRLVRHPMYLGYIIAQLGYLLHNFSGANVALYVAAWSLQVARATREERLLLLDDAYQSYSQRTRYRLIPGLF